MFQSLPSSVIITLAFNYILTSLFSFKQLFSFNAHIFLHPAVAVVAYKPLELHWESLGGYSELHLKKQSQQHQAWSYCIRFAAAQRKH